MPRVSWKEDLELAYHQLEKKKPDNASEISKYLEKHVAKKYGLALSTVKKAYQKRKKETDEDVESKIQLNDSAEEAIAKDIHDSKEEMDSMESTPQQFTLQDHLLPQNVALLHSEDFKPKTVPNYHYGDLIQVEVTAIVPYGVFVITLDEHNYQGLIHITEVREGFVSNLNEYFQVGDVFTAKVRRMDPQGKLAFTTKGLSLPKHNPIPEEETPSPTAILEDDRELAEVIAYMNEIIGMVSPQAKEALKELIAKHGLFKFTMTLGKVAPTFEADIGKMLIKEVEKKIGDRL